MSATASAALLPLPYKRLGGFYFFWFASIGVLLPYWGLYMQDRGYRPAEIGAVFGLLMLTKMVAPNVWGWFADHHGNRLGIIRMATAVAALMFLCVPLVDGFLLLALCMTGYGFFANASLPQFEAVTFNHLGGRESHYGRIRLWGSVGFILSVVTLGPILERVGSAPVPWWIVACLTGLFVISLQVPAPPRADTGAPGIRLWPVFRQPEVAGLLGVCFLNQFSHAAYYGFFSIYMEDYGYGRSVIGVLWAIGVTAEIAVFACLPLLVQRIGLRHLMLAAMALTTLRWLLLALLPQYAGVIVFSQLLHLASFGIYHAVAVNLIHRMFRGPLQGRGQALYSSLSFGAGGAAGSFSAGLLWEWLPPAGVFLLAAAAAALGWLLAWWTLRGEVMR